jgi:hypothetical protein
MEEWRAVKGLEGLYEVSSQGRVRSLDRQTRRHRIRGRVLKPTSHPKGYLVVIMSVDGVWHRDLIHRLVARAFLPASDLPEVNHKDFDKTNNRVQNLEWCSRERNHAHATDAGRYKASHNPNRGRKLNPEKVAEIRSLAARGIKHGPIAATYGVCRPVVSMIVSNRIWRS